MTEADTTETRRALADRARGRFGKLDVGPIVDLVVRTTDGADFPLRAAALDALARRREFAERDDLRVLARPASGTIGCWGVGRRGAARRYELRVRSVTPLDIDCACADYVRSSLGLCKHGLVVLAAAGKRRTRGAAITREPRKGTGRLIWSPVHPLRGSFDRVSRLQSFDVPRLPAGENRAFAYDDADERYDVLRRLQRSIDAGTVVADPSAGTVVREELARARRAGEARANAPRCEARLRDLARRLYPYQREGVLRFLRTGRLLLADDMGLGKTTQAIAICHALLTAKIVKRALLVAPASLKPQWSREWSATTAAPLTSVDGSPAERAKLYAETSRGALIVGYEQLLRDVAHVREWAPELVVLDEAQRIKNWATKSALTVKSLSAPYRLVLTGTPMENRLDELASIVDFVDDIALEPKWRLAPFHSYEQGDGADGVSGARHLDVLRARLAPVMLRRLRKEVIAQLPERTDTRVPVEMTAEQRAEHDDLNQPIAVLLGAAAKRPLRQPEFLRLMALLAQQRVISNGLAQLRFDDAWERCQHTRATQPMLASLFAPKLGALRTLISDLTVTQQRKVVVFSQWRRMLRLSEWAVRDVLADAGLRAMFFTGAESGKLRERALVDFHDDPSVAALFLTDAGGVGLNLQRAASACVQLELPWNPAVMEQRIGRIHRIGQARPIDVFHLVTEEGIESRIAGLLSSKRALFTSLFDGTTDEVVFDRSSSFLSSVRAVIEADPAATAAAEPAPPDQTEDALDLPPDELALDAAQSVATAPTPPTDSDAIPSPSVAPAPFQVTRRPDGGLAIEVPPAMAEPLAGLLASLADALRANASVAPR